MAYSQPKISLDALARRFAHFATGEAEEFSSPWRTARHMGRG